MNNIIRQAVTETIASAIAETLYVKFSVPKQISKAVIKTAFAATAGHVSYDNIVSVLNQLGAPQALDMVVKTIKSHGINVFSPSKAISVLCPVTGSRTEVGSQTGQYSCPLCGHVIVVDGNGAVHIPVSRRGSRADRAPRRSRPRADEPEVVCPVSEDVISVGTEDGDYSCPDCGGDINLSRGKAKHARVASVQCPDSGARVSLCDGDGEYTCPECGDGVRVIRGRARHL